MLRLKVHRKLKGSIALYVLYWGMLCITMVMLGYSLEIGRKTNIKHLEKQMGKSDLGNKYREALFSDFHSKLLENDVSMEQDEIDNFIFIYGNRLVLSRGEGKLYLKPEGILMLKYIDETSKNVFEFYSVKSKGGKLKFIKVQGVYADYNYDL